ncbi:MAG: hypothetical protein ABW321_30390, partial [Polyangiales bacterium]
VALSALPRVRAGKLATAVLAVGLIAPRLPARTVNYVDAGEKPLAQRVRGWLAKPDTGLLLFPWANWAFAYYTDSPVRLTAVTDSTNGFFAVPERPHSWVLPETYEGVFFSDYARDTHAFDAQLAPLYAAAPRRLVFYGSYGDDSDYRAMLRQLKRRHYVVVREHARDRAIAVLLERR